MEARSGGEIAAEDLLTHRRDQHVADSRRPLQIAGCDNPLAHDLQRGTPVPSSRIMRWCWLGMR
jgi:hypothetical protein